MKKSSHLHVVLDEPKAPPSDDATKKDAAAAPTGENAKSGDAKGEAKAAKSKKNRSEKVGGRV
jgi:hypothetical protein